MDAYRSRTSVPSHATRAPSKYTEDLPPCCQRPPGTAGVPAGFLAKLFSNLPSSPAPLLHAASKAMRQIFYEGLRLLVAAYRTAAEKLKRGDPNPGFPPALPFVGG